MIAKSFSPVGLVALLISSPLSNAAPDTVDSVFASSAGQVFTPSAYGGVSSVLVQPDGKILFGSNEMPGTVGGNPLQMPLIRFNPDGTVDNTFFADNEPNGSGTGIVFDGAGWPEVHALGLLSDGKIVAAGVMDGMRDGTNTIVSNSIVRLNPDGTLDTTFQTRGTTQWPTGGFNYIEDVTVQPDDKVIVTGGFGGIRNTTGSAVTRYGIGRFNLDGSLDTGFQINPLEFGVPAGAAQVRGFFRQAALDSAGNIYVAGSLEWGNTFPAPSLPVLAKLYPNGVRDTSFNPALPANLSGVDGVVVGPDGNITALGQFNSPATTSWMARFTPAGAAVSFALDPSLGVVDARPLQRDSAGRFLLTSGNSLVRILATGALDATFNASSQWVIHPGGSPVAGYLGNFTTAANGKIYAGGGFDTVDGVSSVKLVAFDGDAVADEFRWSVVSPMIVENSGFVRLGVTRQGNATTAGSVSYATTSGSALSGSDFTAASGSLSWLAGETGTKWISIPISSDTDAEAAETFSITLSSPAGASIGGSATAVVSILDDEAVPVITAHPSDVTVKEGFPATFGVSVSSPVPPTFQWYKNGQLIPGATAATYSLLAVTSTDGADYTVEVYGSGSPVLSDPATLTIIPPGAILDPAYNPSGIDSTAPVTFLPDGSLLAINGSGTTFSVVKYDATGTAVSTWPFTFTIQSGYSASLSLLPLPSGKFLISGNFTVINGVSRNRIARIDANGTVDETFNAGLDAPNSGSLSGLTVTPSGRVYLRWKPQLQSGGIRRLLESGAADPSFSTTLTDGTSGFLWNLTELPDGSLLIGHTSGSGTITRGLVKLTETGAAFPGFNANNSLFPEPRIVVPLPDGRFIVARNNLLEIRLANGNVDPSFSLAGAITGNINSVVLQRGRIVIAGPSVFNGQSIPGIARFSMTGQWDDNFPAGTGPAGGTVTGIALVDQDRLLVRGTFTSWNGQSRNRFARLVLTADEAGFESAATTRFENAGPFVIRVVRLGDTAGTASVRVTSANGTAASPADFTAIDQTVSWAAGDGAPKEITITPVNNAALDGDRAFTLSLSGPVDLTLVPQAMTLTLRDDESMPVITAQPQEVFGVLGKPASLSVTATSPTTASYQWYLNGTPLSGATAATYSIASVALANEGTYTVVITNAYSSVTSASAKLTIIPDPSAILPGYTPFTGFGGGGLVYGLAVASDGGAYAGGVFTDVGGDANRDYLVKINANGTLDTGFNPPLIGGTVKDVAVQSDGKVIAVGTFTTVAGSSLRRVVRLETNGELDTGFSTTAGLAANGAVNAVEIEPAGTILLGGNFSSWNNVDLGVGDDLIRLNPNGSVARNISFDGNLEILDIQLLPDGKILVCYNTTGSSDAKVRRLNADLTLDNTFTYSTGRTKVEQIALASNGNYLFAGLTNLMEITPTAATAATFPGSGYFSAARQLNGKVLAGGTSGTRLFRYLATATADPSFSPTGAPSGSVYRLAVRGDGKVWVGGQFATYNGSTVNGIMLLNGDPIPLAITGQPQPLTIKDPGEDVQLSVTATGTTVISYQWFRGNVPLSDGPGVSGSQTATLLLDDVEETDAGNYTVTVSNAAGTQTSSTAELRVRGAPLILSISGPVTLVEGDAFSLTVEAFGAATLTYQWKRGSVVLQNGGGISGADGPTLTVTSAGLAAGGNYTVTVTNSIDDTTSNPVAVTVVENQAVIASGHTPASISAIVRQVFPLPSGKVLVGGDFAASGEHGARLRVINPDGSIHPVPGLSADGSVYAIRPAANGKILIAGSFNNVNGQLRRRVARLEANLSLDESFDASIGFGQFGGMVVDVAQESSGTILAGGQFSDFNADLAADFAVRLSSAGLHDTSFVSGANSYVNRIFPQADGKAIFLGWFSAWAGNASGAYVARANANGTFDGTTLYPSSSLFTGDGFDLGGGSFIAAGAFAATTHKFNADGTKDTGFLAQGASNATITAGALDAQGRILVGGNFTTIAGAARNRLVRLNANGTRDDTFGVGTGVNGVVEDVSIATDGAIWVAGNFTAYRGVTVSHLVRLKGASGAVTDPVLAYLTNAGVPANLRGDTDDADSDGIANLIEYLYQTGPANGGQRPQPFAGSSIQSGASIAGLDPLKNYRVIQVEIPENLLGLTVAVQVATDLSDFGTGPATATEFGTRVDNGTTETRSYYLTPATEDAAELFWRLGVSR